jgi:polyisoprenyl-phosphate glycosyltransferase
VRILRLHRNLGHQRAICVALCHLLTESDCVRVLVMDGDGEDAPDDIPRLLNELDSNDATRIVFAERAKRTEGWLFSFFYAVYKFLHLVLVGQRVRVGNFSVMNRECLESLCTSSELWNHYAASAFATRQPMSFVRTNRSTRLAGHSTMNFPSLVTHGLSALSVFSDRISTRSLIFSGIAASFTLIGMVVVTLIRLSTGYAIPGWATNAFGILFILLVQITTFMLTFCFMILFTRGFSPFIPVRDHIFFVRQIDEVWRGRSNP